MFASPSLIFGDFFGISWMKFKWRVLGLFSGILIACCRGRRGTWDQAFLVVSSAGWNEGD